MGISATSDQTTADRLAAALLLTALAASLSLLTHPSGKAVGTARPPGRRHLSVTCATAARRRRPELRRGQPGPAGWLPASPRDGPGRLRRLPSSNGHRPVSDSWPEPGHADLGAECWSGWPACRAAGDQVVVNRIDQPASMPRHCRCRARRTWTKTEFGIDVRQSRSPARTPATAPRPTSTSPSRTPNPIGERLHQLGHRPARLHGIAGPGLGRRPGRQPDRGPAGQFHARQPAADGHH